MTSLISRTSLFGNPARAAAQISPGGEQVAWLAPSNGVLNVWVAPLGALQDARPVTRDTKRGIQAYRWAYDRRHLVFLQDEGGDENYHLFAVELETGEIRDLTPFDGVTVWLTQPVASPFLPSRLLFGLNLRDRRFFDLHTVDLETGERRLVAENPGFLTIVANHLFEPYLATQLAEDGTLRILRQSAHGWTYWLSLEPADPVNALSSSALSINVAQTAIHFLDSRDRDTAALWRLDIGTGDRAIIAARNDVDISEVVLDQETREPIAYGVNGMRLEQVALAPELQEDFDFLTTRDIGDWRIQSRSEDDRKWTIVASSDIVSNVTYLYDRDAHSLRALFSDRPDLDDAPLARMQPVAIVSRDKLDLVSYLTLPRDALEGVPQPLVLTVHGGPWGRDSFGFNPLHQWLANRGYAALSVNFRSSTGFGKAFVKAGEGEWGRAMDDDLLDAVAWAIEKGIADRDKIAIFGASYGGYATLVGLTRNPDVYACGVDIVGPSNLETVFASQPAYWTPLRTLFVNAWGDPTTESGRRLLRERSPLFQAHRVSKPLLIAQGANDARTKRSESEQMVEALRSNGVEVTYLLYSDEGHVFVRPQTNLSFYAVAERFLARSLGGKVEPMTDDERGVAEAALEAGEI